MEHNHFTLVVADDNPEELIKGYSNRLKVEPWIVVKFSEAKKYHDSYIKYYEKAYELSRNELEKNDIKKRLDYYQSIDDVDFFLDITEDYDIDEKTGDAMSTNNPNGRYDSCKLGKELSLPMLTKDGKETYLDIKNNIDWEKIHLFNKKPYEVAWDCVMGNKPPENADEENIYNNMKNKIKYFEAYGDRETYVASNSAFWGYAFLSKDTGWVELKDNENQFDWVISFFDKFIKPLPDEKKIGIFECIRF